MVPRGGAAMPRALLNALQRGREAVSYMDVLST